MAQVIHQDFLTESLSLISENGPKAALWTCSNIPYYDLTPPSETVEVERPLISPSSIDISTTPLVAVIGVGYVGEHLVSIFSQHFDVLGFDVSETRIAQLSEAFKSNLKVKFISNPSELAHATHFLISVPTLLLPDKTIDSSYLRNALAAVGLHARRGSVVVVESSVAVGMTRSLLGPLARERGFYAGMSPERVDPGRVQPLPKAIPKVISGLDDVVPGSLDAISRLYSQAFDQVIPVSRPEVAEMMKLYENCQRMVCIAYANEMANACIPHGINPFEVCSAASTKPFGYMPYNPGLGVGGHCIPVNPYYLLSNNNFPLLEAAAGEMRSRPSRIACQAIQKLYSRASWEKCSPTVLVVGMGFKPGQSHLANSPGLELAKALVLTQKAKVLWADPLVKQEAVPQIPRLDEGQWTVEGLQCRFNMIIIAFRQRGLDFGILNQLEDMEIEYWCP